MLNHESIKELAVLDQKTISKISLLVKDYKVWEALLTLIYHHKAKAYTQLIGEQRPDELVRIAARIELLDQLARTRDVVLAMEKNRT